MKDALILEHRTYISARRAAEITGYTSDYVGQLCRANKVESKIVGRSWFVLEESLLKHKLINDEVKTNKKTAKRRRALRAQESLPEISGVQFISQDEVRLAAPLSSEKPQPVIVPAVKVAEVQEEIKKEVEIKYEAVISPLMPLLKKAGDHARVQFVPSHFSMRGKDGKTIVDFREFNLHPNLEKSTRKISSSTLTSTSISARNSSQKFSPHHFKNVISGGAIVQSRTMTSTFAVALILLTLVVGSGMMMQSSFTSFGSHGSSASHTQEASLASVSKDIFDSIIRGWVGVTHGIAYYLGFGSKTNGVATNENNPSRDISLSDLGYDGIAVAPSTNSPTKDEIIKERIRESFSDEVQVHPDQSGTAGVITPVFKKATKDNFVYVLVPVQQTRQ